MENKPTILVVDDEDLLREAIVFQFKREGFNVLSASNGVEAFHMIQNNKIDAVVSDIQMPGGNGIDLLKNVKDFDAEIPVMVFITAFADLTEEEAYDLGANAIFSKPFDRKVLVKCIKDSILSKGRPWTLQAKPEKTDHLVEGQSPVPVGRGGTVVKLPVSARIGETVGFQVPAQIGEAVTPLNGTGIVRWTDGQGSAGIEFTSLNQEGVVSMEEWLNRSKIKPFIPKKKSA